MRKSIFLIICLLFGLLLKSQTGNVWTFATQTGLDFNCEPPKVIESQITNIISCSSISDSLGNLLFYTDGMKIWNNNHTIIDSFNLKRDSGIIGSFRTSILPTQKTNEYLILSSVSNKMDGFWHTPEFIISKYKFNPISKTGYFIYKNTIIDTIELYEFKIKPSSKPGIMYELFTNDPFSVYIYEIDTANNVFLRNKITKYENGKQLYPENINAIAHHSNYLFISYTHNLNDSIFFNFYQYDTNYNLTLINSIKRNAYGYSMFELEDSIFVDILFEVTSMEFSPNDSLLYFIIEKRFAPTKYRYGILQYDIFNPQSYYFKFQNSSIALGGNLRLAPNGKILTPNFHNSFISTINNPDIKGPGCHILFNNIDVSNKLNKGISYSDVFPNTIFTYQRVQFATTQSCDGIAFYNRSDTGLFKTFTWFFSDTDSLVQTTPHLNRWSMVPVVTHDFKTKGNYLVKLKGTRSNGSHVWWSNEIDFIPLKPRAKFTTQSAQGCQYVSFQFNDSSASDTLGALGYSYSWDFGDGSNLELKNSPTRIPIFNHTYTSSGIFTVRLIFSNGICIDTFSILNSVNILPAPLPYFKLSSHHGCVPFTVQITDTLKSNLLKKEFDFGNGYISLSSSQPLDTTIQILAPGTYIINQRLTGATGCITQFVDSFKVLNGVSKLDTVQTLFTTVLDSTSTQTVWKSLPYAVKYQINSKLTKDTFYIDHAANPALKSQAYYVRGVDTCGNQSAISLVAQTIYLKATNSPYNEYALLEYTPYLTWKEGVLNYRIEYFNEATQQWLSLSTAPPNLFTYHANVLPSTNGILNLSPEICYRIIATEQNGNQQISTSNEACIPVYPVAFIPNAFSPNHDGINEYFKPITAGLSTYLFEIYDRWGTLVYTDTPESKGWDGSFKGAPAEAGTYIYRLSAAGYLKSPATNDARLVERKGTLILIR